MSHADRFSATKTFLRGCNARSPHPFLGRDATLSAAWSRRVWTLDRTQKLHFHSLVPLVVTLLAD